MPRPRNDKPLKSWKPSIALAREFAARDGFVELGVIERRYINGYRAKFHAFRRALFDAADAGDREAKVFADIMTHADFAWIPIDRSAPASPDQLVTVSWIVERMYDYQIKSGRFDPIDFKTLYNRQAELTNTIELSAHERSVVEQLLTNMGIYGDYDAETKTTSMFESECRLSMITSKTFRMDMEGANRILQWGKTVRIPPLFHVNGLYLVVRDQDIPPIILDAMTRERERRAKAEEALLHSTVEAAK
jgi:hypothetical protein